MEAKLQETKIQETKLQEPKNEVHNSASVEAMIEQALDRWTSHPLFLNSVAGLINFNSYRKILSRKVLEIVWTQLQVPLKADQEKMQSAIEDLELRLKKLQLEKQAEVVKQRKQEDFNGHERFNETVQPLHLHAKKSAISKSKNSRKISNLN